MLELEIQSRQVRPEDVPRKLIDSFTRKPLARRSVLAWGEHCTECAIPKCFRTCDLYERRSDGKCRRFTEGIVKIPAPNSHYGFITRMTFKPWGSLYTPGSTRVLAHADAAEGLYRRVATGIRHIPSGLGVGRYRVPRAFYQLCKYAVRLGRKLSIGSQAEYFLLQVHNPEPAPLSFSLEMRSWASAGRPPLAKLFRVDPGYHEVYVHVDEIRSTIDTAEPFSITLTPNIESEPVTAYFGIIDFVAFASPAAAPYSSRKMKVLVWDLDNTLWEGILVESDPASIRLRPEVAEVLRRLDERGILLSVASKNHPEMAMEVLKRLGVEEYFLHPQISWAPKSLGIRRIRERLNIGMDTIAFLDDSHFERAEVGESIPEVLCLDAINYTNLCSYPCFAGSASADSKKRRLYYRAEEQRKAEMTTEFEDDYASFLRSCDIRLAVGGPTDENFDRINDLVQRTNQMNFSANRYTRDEVAAMIANDDLDVYVMSASDRFGEYGIIGLAMIERGPALVRDMTFSCRIQMKRIEHAFLCHVLRKYKQQGAARFRALYAPNKRNSQCAKVFDDLGFEKVGVENGREVFAFDFGKPLPAEDLVTVVGAQ